MGSAGRNNRQKFEHIRLKLSVCSVEILRILLRTSCNDIPYLLRS